MGDERDFTITQHRDGDATVVAPVGEVDLVTVDELRSAILAGAKRSPRIVLDLRQVTFMDSSALRLLVEAEQQARQDGFTFAVVRGPASLERLFEVTGLDERLELHDDPRRAARGGDGGR